MVDWFGQLITQIGSENLLSLGTKALNVFITIIIGFFVAKISSSLLRKFFNISSIKSSLERAGYENAISKLIIKSVKYFVYFITALTALAYLGMSSFIVNLIIAIIILIVLLVVVISLKDFIPNASAGFYILRSSILKKGDKVKYENMPGVVEKVQLLSTIIKTKRGKTVIIPNSTMIKMDITKR